MPCFHRAWLGPLLLSLTLAACGRAPLPLGAQAGLLAAQGKPGTLPLTLHFTEAYKPTVAENEPLARKSATNPDKPLLQLISQAKQSLDGAFFDIEDLGVVKAFVAAKARGVKVRLVTDSDNVVDKVDPKKPRPAIVLLQQAGIPLVLDGRSGFMHHKFLIADGQALWCGSTNLTTSSLYRNNNNAMVWRHPAIAKAYAGEFDQLFVHKRFSAASRAGQAPVPPIAFGATKLRIFFSPGGGGRSAVVSSLKAARKSVHFLAFSLTDQETGTAMLERAKGGVQVQGVFDRWLAAGKYSLFNAFKAAKLGVWKDGNEALMHHKAMVLDGQTLISGSYNYSQNAELNNNENFMILENAPQVAAAFEGEFQKVRKVASRFRGPDRAPVGVSEWWQGVLGDPPPGDDETPALPSEDEAQLFAEDQP